LQPRPRAQSRTNRRLPVRVGGNGAGSDCRIGKVIGKPEHDVPPAHGEAVAINQLDDERLRQGVAERSLLLVAGQDVQRRGVAGAW
jgi:hypothetical protein